MQESKTNSSQDRENVVSRATSGVIGGSTGGSTI